MICHLREMRKITAFVAAELLATAQAYTEEGITETLRRGLEELAHAQACRRLLALKGKVFIDLDLEASRADRDLGW